MIPRRNQWMLLLFLLQPGGCVLALRSSGAVPTRKPPQHHSSGGSTRLFAADDVNGNNNAAAPGLVRQADTAKSQLFDAFTNLDLSDQYDAVLTGLCAKILDNSDSSTSKDEVMVQLQDCTKLLQEMNDKRIDASPRSIMAMVDSTVKTQDAERMALVMSQCLQNSNGITQYGAQQADLTVFPSSPQTKVLCPDGKRRTLRERLDDRPAIPTDDRAKEVSSALAFAAVAAACEFTNLFGLEDFQPAANAILFLLLTVGAVDNFYDILKNGSQFIVNQFDKKAAKEMTLPAKDSLPLGLGSGKVTGSVVRGLTRLTTVDAERESQCEAAALVTAYILGLPCYAFQPNAYEAALLCAENKDLLQSSAGILRMLVWLYSSAAMESATHPQLIMSDPRQGQGFLERIEEYYVQNVQDDAQRRNVLFWTEPEGTRDDLLQWAYTEADLLLRNNKDVVAEVSKRLTGGAATIGDCVAVVENW